MKSKFIKLLLIVFFILLNVGCDQSTKYIAKANLEGKPPFKMLGDLIVLCTTYNNGAFLSMGSNWPFPLKITILTIFPSIFLVIMLIYAFRSKTISMINIFGFCCIIGGGFSNLIDRITNNGYVFDFMNFGIGPLRTGIMNFADLSILLGALILVFFGFYGEISGEKKENEPVKQ